jgi:DNA-directed RNA polymerase subunit RPC12/RpoP
MPLVACPQCGAKVPARAATCPTCGHRMPHPSAWKATELVGVLAFVGGVAVATLGSAYGLPAALYAGLGGIGLGIVVYAAGWVMALRHRP